MNNDKLIKTSNLDHELLLMYPQYKDFLFYNVFKKEFMDKKETWDKI